jgi:hypothetical protein
MTGIDLPRVTFITCKLVLSETIPLIRRTIALRRPRALTDIAARLFSMILVDIPPGLATPKIKAQKANSHGMDHQTQIYSDPGRSFWKSACNCILRLHRTKIRTKFLSHEINGAAGEKNPPKTT